MDELVEGVLAVGAGLSPEDGAGVGIHRGSVKVDMLAVGLHGELLEIGRKALEILVVGKDRHRLAAEEVRVPDGEKPHEDREVFGEGSGPEVLVHGMEALEHLPEVLRSDGDHGGEADGGIHGVAASDPVPEAEHVGGVDPEGGDGLAVGRDGDEVMADGLFLFEALQEPATGGMGVGHGFEGGEGLGADDEEGLLRVEVPGGLRKIGPVDVGDEAEDAAPVGIEPEGLIGHHRPQVGAADADVDDILDRPSRGSLPGAVPDLSGEALHPVEDLVDLPDDIDAVHHKPGRPGQAKGHVKDGPVLGLVDVLASEHVPDVVGEPAAFGQLQKKVEGPVGDAVFGVVEENPRSFRPHPRGASRVAGEELPQMR